MVVNTQGPRWWVYKGNKWIITFEVTKCKMFEEINWMKSNCVQRLPGAKHTLKILTLYII